MAGIIEPDRPLVDGVVVDTDLGPWEVVETPGHAPSHVCLFQRERRLMISGDHLLGRISLYYDYGYSPDPAGEFLQSLERVEDLAPRLCLPGHGRTFADVEAHIPANRGWSRTAERIQDVLGDGEPLTVVDVPARLRRGRDRAQRALVAVGDAVLPATPGDDGRAEGDGASPERWRMAA